MTFETPDQYKARILESLRELGDTCQHCGASGAIPYRCKTAYLDDLLNWTVLCAPCQSADDEYWDERWAEYYAGAL